MSVEKIVDVTYRLTRQTTGKTSMNILSLKVDKEGVFLGLANENEKLTWGQLVELETIISKIRNEFDPNLPKEG